MADALTGKKGWFFLCNDTNGCMEQYQGLKTFSEHDLQNFKRVLESRKQFYESQGVAYIFAVAPNKESIYPEFLPDEIEKSSEGTPFERLLAYMAANSDFEILDLSLALVAAKPHHRLYQKTDTHWNHIGAFAAYRAIMRKIRQVFPNVTAQSIDAFRLKQQAFKEADLAQKAKMMFKGGKFLAHPNPPAPDRQDPDIFMKPKVKRAEACSVEPYLIISKTRSAFVFQVQDPDLPRVLFYRDSFGTLLMPYLAETCQRLACVWTPTPLFDLNAKEKPDIVIQVMVERFLIAGAKWS